jgi:hypothetical protein
MMMKDIYYILNYKNEVVPAKDHYEWGKWFEENPAKRRVDFTKFHDEFNTEVSTVFVGLAMNAGITSDDGPHREPMVFESMVFSDNPDTDGYQWRYSNFDKAQEGHDYLVQEIYKHQLTNGTRKKLKLNLNFNNLTKDQ